MKRILLWGVAGAVLALGLLAFIVPRPAEGDSDHSFTDDVPEVAAALTRFEDLMSRTRDLRQALFRISAMEIAARLPPVASQSGLTFSAAPEVSQEVRERFKTRVDEEFAARNGPTKMSLRVHLAYLKESAEFERFQVLPTADGAPCTTVILVGPTAVRVAPGPNEMLLGTCSFYARYGMPGPGMQRWLERTRGEFATTDSVLRLPPRTELIRIQGFEITLVPLEARCAAEDFAACATLFDEAPSLPFRFLTNDTFHLAATPNVVRGRVNAAYGKGTHLAAMLESAGSTRFAQIWGSTLEPPEAYEMVDGRPIGAFMHELLMKEFEPHQPGPLGARFPLLLGVLVSIAFTAAGIRFTPRRWR